MLGRRAWSCTMCTFGMWAYFPLNLCVQFFKEKVARFYRHYRGKLIFSNIGPRITFAFLDCALCKKPIKHPALDFELNQIHELKKDIEVFYCIFPVLI